MAWFLGFENIFSFIQTHGYFVLFLMAIIEGPTTTAAGAFVASLGLLNIFIILAIAFLGDLIGDSFYFFVGKFGKKSIIDKYDGKFGINKNKRNFLERKIDDHYFKTLAMCKFTPLLAPPCIMMIGASGISFRKFLLSTSLIIIPTDILYATLGYTLGVTSYSFFNYFKIARWLLLVLILLGILVSYIIEKGILRKIVKKFGINYSSKNF